MEGCGCEGYGCEGCGCEGYGCEGVYLDSHGELNPCDAAGRGCEGHEEESASVVSLQPRWLRVEGLRF